MKKYIFICACFILLLFCWSCKDDATPTVHSWQLVWQDEFEGVVGQLPDKTKWTYDIGTGSSGWGNNQLEYDTNRPENVSLDGSGHLVIKAIKESYQGSAYTSARIKTKGLFEPQYGRFEARMKMPTGQGLWPAFWMLGTNIENVGWPKCGEIDIMEYRGQEPSKVLGSIHGPGYSGGNCITKSYTLTNARFDMDYHLFAIEWTKEGINFFIDDVLYEKITPNTVSGNEWVYDHPFFIILNLAVGGNFVGSPNSYTTFPQSMVVDYVRVYKQIEN